MDPHLLECCWNQMLLQPGLPGLLCCSEASENTAESSKSLASHIFLNSNGLEWFQLPADTAERTEPDQPTLVSPHQQVYLWPCTAPEINCFPWRDPQPSAGLSTEGTAASKILI